MRIECLPLKDSLKYLEENIPDILVDAHKELHGKPFTSCFDGKTVIAAGREHYILGRNEEFIVICPIEMVSDGCVWGEPRIIRDIEYMAAKQRAIREVRQLQDARKDKLVLIISRSMIVALALLLAATIHKNYVSPPGKEKKVKDPPSQKEPIEPSVQKR